MDMNCGVDIPQYILVFLSLSDMILKTNCHLYTDLQTSLHIIKNPLIELGNFYLFPATVCGTEFLDVYHHLLFPTI